VNLLEYYMVLFSVQRSAAATRLRGMEEVCYSVSPSEAADLATFFYQRSVSSNSSGYCGEDELNMDYRLVE